MSAGPAIIVKKMNEAHTDEGHPGYGCYAGASYNDIKTCDLSEMQISTIYLFPLFIHYIVIQSTSLSNQND